MNIENTKKALAYFAELDERRFNMLYWFLNDLTIVGSVSSVPEENLCNTVACIAGHIQLAFASTDEEEQMLAHDFARDFLGISPPVAVNLFTGQFTDKPMREITLDDAVEELKRMAQS